MRAALPLAEATGDQAQVGLILGHLSELALTTNQVTEAERLIGEALRWSLALQDDGLAATLMQTQGMVWMAQQQWLNALTAYRESARIAQQGRHWGIAARALTQAALAAERSGQGPVATHPLTPQLAPEVLAGWKAWAAEHARGFQRASSAVEGRNGTLSQVHHNQRGVPKRRDKVWTVLHNFDCRAADGSTPASRFFRHAFPDLFETVPSKIDDVPRSRQRHQTLAINA